MVTAYDIEKGEPYFFKSWKACGYFLHDQQRKADFDFKLSDVARATSAAPTYYPPANIKNESGQEFWLVDGGVFANNPSVCIAASAISVYPGLDREKILVVSIGTGIPQNNSIVSSVKQGGTIEWGMKIIDLLFSGASSVQHYQMSQIFKQKDNYYLFQVPLDHKHTKMDDTSPENIAYLSQQVEKAITGDWRHQYETLLEILKTPLEPWDHMKEFAKGGGDNDPG